MKMRVYVVVTLLSSLVLASSFAFAGRTLQAGDFIAPIGQDHIYFVDQVDGDEVKVRRVDMELWGQERESPVTNFLGQEQATVKVVDVRRMTRLADDANGLVFQEEADAEGAELGLNEVDMDDQTPAAEPAKEDEVADVGCCACLGIKKFFGVGSH